MQCVKPKKKPQKNVQVTNARHDVERAFRAARRIQRIAFGDAEDLPGRVGVEAVLVARAIEPDACDVGRVKCGQQRGQRDVARDTRVHLGQRGHVGRARHERDGRH